MEFDSSGLSFAPQLPPALSKISFGLGWQGRQLRVYDHGGRGGVPAGQRAADAAAPPRRAARAGRRPGDAPAAGAAVRRPGRAAVRPGAAGAAPRRLSRHGSRGVDGRRPGYRKEPGAPAPVPDPGEDPREPRPRPRAADRRAQGARRPGRVRRGDRGRHGVRRPGRRTRAATQHPADFGTDVANRMESEGLARTVELQRRRVQDALDRLDDGSYGRCAVCGRRSTTSGSRPAPRSPTCREHADALPGGWLTLQKWFTDRGRGGKPARDGDRRLPRGPGPGRPHRARPDPAPARPGLQLPRRRRRRDHRPGRDRPAQGAGHPARVAGRVDQHRPPRPHPGASAPTPPAAASTATTRTGGGPATS